MNRKLKRAVEAFESAVRNHEMKGSMPPEEWHEIELEYRLAKGKLFIVIDLFIHESLSDNKPK